MPRSPARRPSRRRARSRASARAPSRAPASPRRSLRRSPRRTSRGSRAPLPRRCSGHARSRARRAVTRGEPRFRASSSEALASALEVIDVRGCSLPRFAFHEDSIFFRKLIQSFILQDFDEGAVNFMLNVVIERLPESVRKHIRKPSLIVNDLTEIQRLANFVQDPTFSNKVSIIQKEEFGMTVPEYLSLQPSNPYSFHEVAIISSIEDPPGKLSRQISNMPISAENHEKFKNDNLQIIDQQSVVAIHKPGKSMKLYYSLPKVAELNEFLQTYEL